MARLLVALGTVGLLALASAMPAAAAPLNVTPAASTDTMVTTVAMLKKKKMMMKRKMAHKKRHHHRHVAKVAVAAEPICFLDALFDRK